MPLSTEEFVRIMRADLQAVERQCDEVFASLDALPERDPCRPMLLKIHEGLSNIVGTMKSNLHRVS
jgi:hypothetical protein